MQRISAFKEFPLQWELEEYMDLVAGVGERKSYFVKIAFVSEVELSLDDYKVWEVNDGEYLKDIIEL